MTCRARAEAHLALAQHEFAPRPSCPAVRLRTC
nr:DUF2800 domain-containing protein [Corynebacterium sp. HMSC062E11]